MADAPDRDAGTRASRYLQVGPFGCPRRRALPDDAGRPARGRRHRSSSPGSQRPASTSRPRPTARLAIEPQEIFGIVLDPTTAGRPRARGRPAVRRSGTAGLWSGIDLGGSWWDPVGPIDWRPSRLRSTSADGHDRLRPIRTTPRSRSKMRADRSSCCVATDRSTSRSATERTARSTASPRGILQAMARPLSRKIPLAELHCHLGGAVTPAIMWGIAHSQGIKLPDQGLLGVPRHDHGLAAAEPLVRRLPAALPLDRAHPELAARGRAQRLRGRRRRVSQEQRHDDGAALQPDEAKPRRRAGPRPHHRGRGPRAWTRRRSSTRSSPG